MIGMFVHRAVTLGHIISTTKLAPLFKPQKKFNVNEEIDKRGVEFVKSIIKNVQPDDRDDGITIEEAVEKSMIAIASGDADELRRMSEGTALTRRGTIKFWNYFIFFLKKIAFQVTTHFSGCYENCLVSIVLHNVF